MKRPGPLRRHRKRRRVPTIWTANLGPCQVCPAEGGECYGPLAGHHIITQQALRREGLELYLWDLRNRLTVCQGRHDRHHNGTRIARELLPAPAFEFAEEVGLTRLIERYYPADPRS